MKEHALKPVFQLQHLLEDSSLFLNCLLRLYKVHQRLVKLSFVVIKNSWLPNFSSYYLQIVNKKLLNIMVVKMLLEYKGNKIITSSVYLVFLIFIELIETFFQEISKFFLCMLSTEQKKILLFLQFKSKSQEVLET